MSGFQLQRLGLMVEPEPGNPLEAEGVLNPAAARGRDGQLYLFPRLVASGNYSRIGIARVRFNEAGDPAGVERLGIALEPEADYELRYDGSGGCEDPRVILHRSVEPVLTPELPQERRGIVANVVFPTGIDRRDDLGMPDRIDVYYGMADNRIGVARLDVPEHLPPGTLADGP